MSAVSRRSAVPRWMPLAVLAALLGGGAGLWVVSALVLSGGASTITALLAALLVAVAAPLLISGWKYGVRLAAGARGCAVVAVWNVAALAFVVLAVPDPLGLALREHGWVLAAQAVGEDDGLTRAASMLSHEVADTLDAGPAVRPVEVRVPSGSIVVDVELVGPRGRIASRYLWDTGSTYTTLTTEAATHLGIAIPRDAPAVRLDTAAGPRESVLVVLPTLRVGGLAIHGVAASICDTCPHDGVGGLVGLNAMRHFSATLDGPRGSLRMVASTDVDRTADINPFVDLAVEGTPTLVGDHAHWRIRVHNRGSRTLTDVRPQVDFAQGQTLLGLPIATLAPDEIAWTKVKGNAGHGVSGEFTLALHHAHW